MPILYMSTPWRSKQALVFVALLVMACLRGPAQDSSAQSNGDQTASLDSLRRAADQGDSNAQYELGWHYGVGQGVNQDSTQALKWFEKAAALGLARAEYAVGTYYHTGEVVPKDDVVAAQWCRKAADQGLAQAQFALGFMYDHGQGVDTNDEEAFRWYQKAADQGHVMAEEYLGERYRDGNGVKKDSSQAAKWFQEAAAQGEVHGETNIALCYSNGDGVDKDLGEAIIWFRKAANQGNPVAQRDLAISYQTGSGVTQNFREAVRWYRKAAEQGMPEAQLNLGWCYRTGTGVDKDYTQAANWYQKAAIQGNATAEYDLGSMLIGGLGVIKNEIEGLAWLYVSSSKGNQDATREVSSFETRYSVAVIEAARQRATEVEDAITSSSPTTSDIPPTVAIKPVPPPDMPKASGSGAFITSDGLIITAAHVVEDTSRIEIITTTRRLPAQVVKIDKANDVAILKCTGSDFVPLPIAVSKAVRVGSEVFTIGFPNIQVQGFDPKLTKGDISSSAGMQDDPRDWQISVPIQPGNSGGPLCDQNGNLVGIVLATLDAVKMARMAGEIPQNVNYAVKSSYFLPLLDDVPNLPAARSAANDPKFEEVVATVQKSVVLIQVY